MRDFSTFELWREYIHSRRLYSILANSFHGVTSEDEGIVGTLHEVRRNQWHRETILEHLMMVYQNCGEHDKHLQAAALLHDIGKPFMRVYKAEKNKVNFMGHEYASALLSVDFLQEHYTDKQLIEFMLQVITLHTF